MDRHEAEIYLTEIAKSDIDRTKILGLTINCISLDSAYQITREHHPGIDFRFVPKLSEVYNLITTPTYGTKSIGKGDLIFDERQQQLRFRRRPIPFVPGFGQISNYITPFNKFLSSDEYYKGVPIYLVQTSNKPRTVLVEKYFNFISIIDIAYGRFIQYFDTFLGFGQKLDNARFYW